VSDEKINIPATLLVGRKAMSITVGITFLPIFLFCHRFFSDRGDDENKKCFMITIP